MTVAVVGEPGMNGGTVARVQVYQLSGTTRFLNASIESFWSDPQSALSNEFVAASDVVRLYPDATLSLDLPLEPDARYLGIAADLHTPEGQEAWREVVPVASLDDDARVQAVITGGRLTASIL